MKRIFIIFLISFVLQLIFILSLKVPLEQDATEYDSAAVDLIKGRGFSADGINPAPGYIKQGYVLFLAFIYKIFGRSIFAVKIIQAILISLSCIITYKIGRELFNERTGFFSALATALHPAFLAISSHIITEALFTFLLAASIFYLVMAMKSRSLKSYLLSGIFLGLSTQVRLTSVFFPCFILVGLLLFYKEKLYALKVSVLILLAVITISTPWAIRNYVLFGHFNLVTAYGGAVLWIGSYTKGQAHQDNSELKKAMTQIDRQLKKHYSQKVINDGEFAMERQRAYFNLAIENIKKDPLGYIALFPKKISRLWIGSYSGFFMTKIRFLDFFKNSCLIKQHPFILLWKLFVYLFSLAVFCLGIIGMISGFKRWKKILPLYLIVSYFTLLHMVLGSNTRLGIPALPYMIIFATLSIFLISNKLRKARHSQSPL